MRDRRHVGSLSTNGPLSTRLSRGLRERILTVRQCTKRTHHVRSRLAHPRGHDLPLREAAGDRHARHGGHQPSARLGGRRRDAGRRRQRDRCCDRRFVRADRGRADDGRHPRRRHGAYPPGRRTPCGDRQPEHGAARHRPDHLHARSQRCTRHDGRDRPQERRRPDRGRRARQPEGLVRGTRPLRHLPAGRCDGAGNPPRLARLPRHALPARMRHGLRRRHGARCRDHEAVSARRVADRCRHAAGYQRLCRNAAQHRARRPGSAVHRRARHDLRRTHGEVRRLSHAR